MKRMLLCLLIVAGILQASAQEALPRPYDEQIDPMVQVDKALADARETGRNVICQVGGNWCPWCLRFADFIVKDSLVNKVIEQNYVYIHVNYPRQRMANDRTDEVMQRLGNPGRFGFPVMVVLDGEGHVLHTQDSSFLEEGKGYDEKKVLRFLQLWTPTATKKD